MILDNVLLMILLTISFEATYLLAHLPIRNQDLKPVEPVTYRPKDMLPMALVFILILTFSTPSLGQSCGVPNPK